MEIENYKRLSLDVSDIHKRQKEHLDKLLDHINKSFREDELRLYRNGEKFELWLREVSMNFLEDVTNDLKNRAAGIGNIEKDLANQLYNTINNIGSYGLRGNKRLFVGYNKERKVVDRRVKELRRGKHYYANDHKFNKQENSLPINYLNQIVRGDSEKILKQLPNNCIDLMFTSPPYNFGLEYEGQDDAIDWEAYFEKLFAILDECIRVLKFGGRLVINVQPLFSDYIPSHHIISNYLMDKRMIWKGEILWEKNNYNCKYTAWGSWKSPSSPYLKYTWEFVEVFCKGNLKKSGSKENADINADSFKKWVVGKWSIAPERKMKKYGHPAMFPEELANRVLLLFSFKGDVILDPFVGVGTTCVSAKKLKRRYLGIDISEEYCETAKSRLFHQHETLF